MTKIDIISGFLGAGKTTLIKKLLKEALAGTKVVLIENEFGEIGIDGGFLKESGIEITEMNSGCICCSLVGDFETSLKQVMEQYAPERILIEPSGVGKLSDVMRAIQNIADADDNMELNSAVTVVDATKAKVYIKNFGEFFINQIENAGTIILTRTDKADQAKIETAVELIREHNKKATIITTPLAEITGKEILDTFEGNNDLEAELLKLVMEQEHHHHHHHHDHGSHKTVAEDGSVIYSAHPDGECDDEECECHHHHDEYDHDHEHEHHHDHDHDEHDHEHHHHEHHYDENGVCSCGHHHHHHHGHDADEVFTSWGRETAHKYSREELEEILKKLSVEEDNEFGIILRAKGIIPDKDNNWLEFDLVPGEYEIREGSADYTGKLCVIGSQLKEDKVAELFGL